MNQEEKDVITKMVEDIMDKEHETLAALEDDYDDCDGGTCSSCGCDIDLQWLVQLDLKDFAVVQEDEDGGGYLLRLIPSQTKAGVFTESHMITISDVLENDITMSRLPIKIARVSFDTWSVMSLV